MIRFIVYKGKNGKYYWQAKSPNGRIIADGSQGYASRQGARGALRKFQTDMGAANFVTVNR